MLNEIADDFLESVTVFSAEIAKHRKDNESLSAKDIKLHLEQNWGLELELEDEKESEKKKQKIESERAQGAIQISTAPPPAVAPQMYYHNQRMAIKQRLMHHK